MMLQALRRRDAPDVRLEAPPLRRPEVLPRFDGAVAAGGCGTGGVRLLGGPFKRAQERAGQHLLAVATDTLLDAWQVGYGVQADERCSRIGNYLSACSLMWAATGEPAYRRRAEHVVGRLAAWLRATGFGAVRSLAPLRPGLHDARVLAGSALARELLGMLGPDLTAGELHAPRTDVSVGHADRAEHVLINRVLASQQGGGWQFDGVGGPAARAPAASDDEGTRWQRLDGAGIQDPARIGEAIFVTEGDVLCVAQYIAAELSWRDKGLRVSQVTAFPERSAVRLIVGTGRALALTLRLRHPSWCTAMTAHVNGQPLLASAEPGRWLDIDRCWRNGDVVDLEMPMHLRLVPAPDGAGTAMLMYGPMALMAAGDAAADGADRQAPKELPRLALRGRTLDETVRRLGSTLRFSAALSGEDARLELMPCHQAASGHHGQYFELA